MNALVVNFFGGPGVGKSTLAAGVYNRLKQHGVNCEFVHEFAKELTWENRNGSLSNQTWILGTQFEMMRRCMEQVDVIITDTSLLNSAVYCHNYNLPYAQEIENLAVAMFRNMNNLNFYVTRNKPYNPAGRYQNEAVAKQIDICVKDMFLSHEICYTIIPGNDYGIDFITNDVRAYIGST